MEIPALSKGFKVLRDAQVHEVVWVTNKAYEGLPAAYDINLEP